MNISTALIALRGIAMLFNMRSEPRVASSLNLVADGLEAGKDVDDHLAAVAAAMKSGTPEDWNGVADRIRADSARLRGE
jgi:hypothetical protein